MPVTPPAVVKVRIMGAGLADIIPCYILLYYVVLNVLDHMVLYDTTL